MSPSPPPLLRLVPGPPRECALEGLYLAETLPDAAVYANFVTSLDGRIAVTGADGISRVPAGLTNARDWRLFRELQAHAECLVTHGGYLRALAAGTLGNVLQVGAGPDGGDIARWRAERGMAPQPAVAIVSASLDLPIPASLAAHGQPVHVLTTAPACPARVAALEATGIEVLVRGAGPHVCARDVVDALAARGRHRLYLQTGPRMLESALRDGVLSRLYATIRHCLVGGECFDTMLGGAMLDATGSLELKSLYLDQEISPGQHFARFEPALPA